MKLWHNICASNHAWSGGVTPAHLAAIAKAAPAVEVYDLRDQTLVGMTSTYEVRADGCELWALLELERMPEGKWHGESVLVREPGGAVHLGVVALTTAPRGELEAWMVNRYREKVGRL